MRNILIVCFSGKADIVSIHMSGKGDTMRKQKFKLLKSQMRKRKNRRLVTKPARQKAKLLLRRQVDELQMVR